jgi:phosphatidylinositol alpha-1,6-mannosyltransferase
MCPRKDHDGDVEGLGLVYYEAHAAGLPTIGANSGGVPEAIGDAGLIVQDPLDPDEILTTIRTALEPSTYQDLAAKVAQRQLTHSWDRFISEFETWYDELAA